MSTFYVYLLDTLGYLGIVEAADREVACMLASAVWPVPVKVLSWRLRQAEAVP
jgi:hypothetical protein